ncbi:sensor histidine kinase [Lachnobacterium bovis]|nr:ATP-binding protein [Lachnobacterium bovis]
MFFDVFADENQEQKGKIFKTVAIVILGLLYFGLGRILSSQFLVKEVIVITVTAMVMVLLRDFGIKKAPILAFLFQGILVAMEYLAYVFIQMIVSDETNVSDTEGVLSTFIAIVDMLLVFLCVVLVRRLFKGHKNKMLYDEEWLKFIVFPIFTIISIGAFISSFRSLDDPNQLRMLYIVSLGLIMMNIFVFYLLEDIVRKGEVAKEKEIFELQKKDQLEMYNALKESFEKQKSESHEFKNHIMFIRSLVENGEYESLKEYVRDVSNQEQGVVNIIDTNHVIINAVINTKYQEAISKHIVFVFRINDLSNIRVTDKDIVVLLSNLLNNAIEACEKCEKERVIKFKFMREESGIILSVKNTFCQPVIRQGDDFLTSKDYERSSHGVGIRNVIKVVNKYGGTYVINDSNKEFYCIKLYLFMYKKY